MVAYPQVSVRELQDDETIVTDGGRIALGARTPEEKAIEVKCNDLATGLRALCDRRYELAWRGGKMPRGAVVAGHVIAWTQNGQVLGLNAEDRGVDIGTYERIVENGGPERDEQLMVIFLYPD